jgi:hypothetical protein
MSLRSRKPSGNREVLAPLLESQMHIERLVRVIDVCTEGDIIA